jgi:nucleolin
MAAMAEGDACRLYVGNLPWEADDSALLSYFSAAGGTIVSAEIMRRNDTGRSKGWGLVTFSTPAEAANAMQFNGQDFDGRPLSVREDRPKAAREPRAKASKGSTTNPMPEGVVSTTCLFVGNLAFECTDDELMAAFSLPSCTPESAVIQMSGRNGGRSRGFGLVTYGTPVEAEMARTQMNETEVGGRTIICRYDEGPRPKRN